MSIDSRTMISLTDAENDFSIIARLVEQYGTAVITKNNEPLYLVTGFDNTDREGIVTDKELSSVSCRLIKRYHTVYQELAK